MLFSHKFLCTFALISLTTQSALAAECNAKSGKTIVPLLELYTSEGCSSCPPADQWLSSLKLGADKLTPLAFHVDYWDYIGWKDPFAKTAYSERQRKIAAFGGAGFVYTPQFTFNGKDFRSWNDNRLRQGIESISKEVSHVDLTLKLSSETNGERSLKSTAQTAYTDDARQADIFIAIYENKLNSQVHAGENSGRELKHDYVVRELLGPYPFDSKNFAKTVTLKSEWKGRDVGAVMFVQNRSNGNVLQSLQLPICN
jgi:hypothetical protein